MVSWLFGLAFGACPETVGADRLLDAADVIIRSYAEIDQDAGQVSDRALRDAIPCLGEPLAPREAAYLHRALGMGMLMWGRDAPAVEHWRAALALEPFFDLPPDLRVGSLGTVVQEARAAPRITYRLVPTHPGGALWVDGVQTERAPETVPYLYQWSIDGRVVQSDLVAVGGLPELVEPASVRPWRPVVGLLASGASLALAGAATGGGAAWYARSREVGTTDLDARLRAVNTAGWAGSGVGALLFASGFAFGGRR